MRRSLLVPFVAVLVVACSQTVPNTAPTADAGANQTATAGATVTLAGSGTDADGDALTFRWTGPLAISLTDADTAAASFTAPSVAAITPYEFRLTVTDSGGLSDVDTVLVTVVPAVANRAPTADAGADQTVSAGALVTLAGSGTDADGDALTFAWTGPPEIRSLSFADAPTAYFVAPSVTVATSYEFTLTVTDRGGLSGADTATVTVEPRNRAPTADAGADQTVAAGAPVTLAGRGTDPDGDALTFAWTGPSSISLTDADTAAASFTAPSVTVATSYEFTLTVTDSAGLSGADTVTVTVAVPVVGTIGEPITDTWHLPQSLPGKGELTKRDLMIGGCRADWVRVIWDFYSIFGSAVVYGNYEWDGDRDCKPHYGTVIWYKVEGSNGGFGYVRISPVVPNAGAGLGFDTPSSPNWNNLLCGFENNRKTECLGERSAKHVYRLSKVTDFVIGWPLE